MGEEIPPCWPGMDSSCGICFGYTQSSWNPFEQVLCPFRIIPESLKLEKTSRTISPAVNPALNHILSIFKHSRDGDSTTPCMATRRWSQIRRNWRENKWSFLFLSYLEGKYSFGVGFSPPWKFEIHNHKAFIENTAPNSNIWHLTTSAKGKALESDREWKMGRENWTQEREQIKILL